MSLRKDVFFKTSFLKLHFRLTCKATHVNWKWTSCILEQCFGPNFQANRR